MIKKKNTSERDYNTTKAAIWKCGEVQAAKHSGIANNNHKLDQMMIIISKMQKKKKKNDASGYNAKILTQFSWKKKKTKTDSFLSRSKFNQQLLD